jgi:Flp pilus assembly protein TadD
LAPAPAAVTWGGARRSDEIAHLRQGVVLQARGEHAAAIEAFTKAIAADATCIEAYASRGISREALGDVDGARADYAKSIEVEVKAGIARHLAGD